MHADEHRKVQIEQKLCSSVSIFKLFQCQRSSWIILKFASEPLSIAGQYLAMKLVFDSGRVTWFWVGVGTQSPESKSGRVTALPSPVLQLPGLPERRKWPFPRPAHSPLPRLRPGPCAA